MAPLEKPVRMPTHCRWYGWSSLQSIYLVSGRNLWQLWSWCWRYLCRWFGEGEWFRAFSQARNAHYGWLAEFCFAIIKCKRLEFQEVLSLLEWYLVSLIIALLISGLVIDLGGGPNHERIGFRVSDKLNTNMASLMPFISTGAIQAQWTVLILSAILMQIVS